MATIVTPELRAKLVATAKARENKEDIVSLVGNLPSMRLILIWPTVNIQVPEGEARNMSNLMRDCRKIWLGVELDYEDISNTARIPYSVVKEHVFEAQMNLWIYPDNTVHQYAKELAKATIVKVAKGKESE